MGDGRAHRRQPPRLQDRVDLGLAEQDDAKTVRFPRRCWTRSARRKDQGEQELQRLLRELVGVVHKHHGDEARVGRSGEQVFQGGEQGIPVLAAHTRVQGLGQIAQERQGV